MIWLLISTITACTVVQAVVKDNSQSNGKSQTLTPRGSETPERISMKLGIYNRVAGMPTHANPCGAVTSDNVGGLGEHVKKHLLWFLRYTFKKFLKIFLLYSSARWHILGLRTGPEVEISNFWKSKMADGRHLEKSPHPSRGLSDFDKIWHADAVRPSVTLLSVPTVWNFQNPRWRRPPSWTIENRPYLWNGLTDLREIWHDDAYWASERDRKLKFPNFENPRWRRAAIFKIENRPLNNIY